MLSTCDYTSSSQLTSPLLNPVFGHFQLLLLAWLTWDLVTGFPDFRRFFDFDSGRNSGHRYELATTMTTTTSRTCYAKTVVTFSRNCMPLRLFLLLLLKLATLIDESNFAFSEIWFHSPFVGGVVQNNWWRLLSAPLEECIFHSLSLSFTFSYVGSARVSSKPNWSISLTVFLFTALSLSFFSIQFASYHFSLLSVTTWNASRYLLSLSLLPSVPFSELRSKQSNF